MEPVSAGVGELFQTFDADGLRQFRRAKDRSLSNKLTSVRDAVSRYVQDGCYIAVGGFGADRIPTALLHEIVRQGRRDLGLSGHTATHDCQILAATGCFNRCDIAYVVGLEARGLSPQARRLFESGRVRMCEWSNAALAWRYKAAAMGVPFLPVRILGGTDTYHRSAARTVRCPFTGIPVILVPALAPDVALIHVHRADVSGNAHIQGILISDPDLARASRHVIVTCEELVPQTYFRDDPARTTIPWFCVDAVVEVPYGSYPGNMPGLYFSDEEHLRQWLQTERDPEQFAAFLKRCILDCEDFDAYLRACGGWERLAHLRRVERLIPEPAAPSGPGGER